MLFGLPRSGTTWLGKVFDSHPNTLYFHEPDSFGNLDGMPLFPEVSEAEQYRELLLDFVAKLQKSSSIRITGKLPQFPKAYRSMVGFLLRKYFLLGGKALSRVTKSEINVPRLINKGYTGEGWIVWKSIESLGRLGVIVRLLPDSHGIHILRHPCGFVSSVQRGESQRLLGGEVQASEDYGIYEALLQTNEARKFALTLKLLKDMHPVERLAWRWVLYNDKALSDCQKLNSCTAVRYEDLCAQPVIEYKKLFEAAGLTWSGQSEDFIKASIDGGGGYYSVFRDPLEAARSWERQLAASDVDRILSVTRRSDAGKMYDG